MGKKIENYCLEQMIGEGEFGKVYRATNEKTQQVVAVKVIKIEKFRMSPKLEEFTINEIQTLSKIEDTTNIVKFIEILKTANNYYFVYDFCNGGTLEQAIKVDGHFVEQKALSYFRDLLKAFKMLIRHNIMHRDIKPSNILLHNGVIKLADFGFCKPLKDARDLAQTMLGSPIYMAPEILKGEIYTMKADIWSLGVVLYEMLFGYCPFEEKTIARLISLIDEGVVTFPPHIRISKRSQELLNRMLVKDHFKRISWDEVFQFDLGLSTENKQRPVTPTENDKPNPFCKKQASEPYNLQSKSSNQSLEQRNPSNSFKPKGNISTGLSMNQNYNNCQNYPQKQKEAYSTNPQSKFGKTDSSTHSQSEVDQQKQITEKRQLRKLQQSRKQIFRGLKMVERLLTQSSSKLSVHICCFLMKRANFLSKQLYQSANRIFNEKENYSIMGVELRKLIGSVVDEKMQLSDKMGPFQSELKQIAEPQDIVYLKFAEEESLTQEREGLIQLLQIDDYLLGSGENYSKLSKRELLEQYQKRVLRKS